MIPLLLQGSELFNVREVILLRVLTLLDLDAISFALHLGEAARFEEEAEKLTGLSNEVPCLFVLLLDTELSLLFNANYELIQVFERSNCVRNILFGGIKLLDFLATTLDDALRLTCICFNALDFINQDYCLVINLCELFTCPLLRIGLISNASFNFCIYIN